MESGILYVVFNKWINDPESNEIPYKIGITRNSIEERYYGLGLKMPGKFETLFAYKIKDYAKAEQSIQCILNKKCVNGEWFKLNQKDLEFIKEICERMEGVQITDEIENEIENETEYDNNGEEFIVDNIEYIALLKSPDNKYPHIIYKNNGKVVENQMEIAGKKIKKIEKWNTHQTIRELIKELRVLKI